MGHDRGMRHRGLVVASTIVVLTLSACGDGPTPRAATDEPTIEAGATPSEEPSAGSPKADEPKIERAPDAAPDFSVTTFDGARFALSEHTGMPVVINFFDSW